MSTDWTKKAVGSLIKHLAVEKYEKLSKNLNNVIGKTQIEGLCCFCNAEAYFVFVSV